MGLPLSELVKRVGDDNVFVQNLAENTTNVRAGKRDTTITFKTGVQFMSPDSLLNPAHAKYVGLVVWLPKADVDRVRDEKG